MAVVRRPTRPGRSTRRRTTCLGLATLFQVPQIDPQAEKQKSCDLAKQEQALLRGADSALTAGRSVNPEAVDKNLGIIKQVQAAGGVDAEGVL